MHKITEKLIDLIPFIIVGALAFIVIGQFIDGQRELEQSRAACYQSAGVAACED